MKLLLPVILLTDGEGFCAGGVSVQGVSVAETPSTVEERAICILLECILVLHNNLLPPEYAMDLFDLNAIPSMSAILFIILKRRIENIKSLEKLLPRPLQFLNNSFRIFPQ